MVRCVKSGDSLIKIKNVEVFGWEAALRGMRMPKQSFDRSDSKSCLTQDCNICEHLEDIGYPVCTSRFDMGVNDHNLAMTLAKAGAVHGKFLRMIHVQLDVTCNQVWWAEFDTYKVSTVRNSSSKMHKIHVKPFEIDDFSHEGCDEVPYAKETLGWVISTCEHLRQDFNKTGEKKYWRALIELLPEGFNMTATIDLNYETLANMYQYRKNHKMFEWVEFCKWIETLPYSELITCRRNDGE